MPPELGITNTSEQYFSMIDRIYKPLVGDIFFEKE